MLKELPCTADEVIELIRATSSIKFIFYCFEFVLSRFDGSDCAFPCSLFCLALGYVNCFILVVCVVNRPVDICDNGFDGTVVFADTMTWPEASRHSTPLSVSFCLR
jgi:hypothetical protein